MAGPKYTCPECKAVLRPAKPLTPGKKVRCPKCEAIFTVEEEGRAPAVAAARPPRNEDDEGGTYGLFDHTDEEAEGKGRKVDYEESLRDKFPKSKRGPAQALATGPSNWLLGTGLLFAFVSLGLILYWGFPLVFSDHLTQPSEKLRDFKDRPWEMSWEEFDQRLATDKNAKNQERYRKAYDELRQLDRERTIQRVTKIVLLGIPGLAYGIVLTVGAVKMQNLESYRWAVISSVLAMPSILGLPAGLWCLKTLRHPDVIAGFEEESVEE
ncbi:MAG: zinc-ribbon domain-containing protein [Gemmataceae bacterium]|nr:zinc-ribbon domain-containing protein [Gemmataceae bacterium]MDW8264986.1 hypothetical protein [Gemmataceae bacterium]